MISAIIVLYSNWQVEISKQILSLFIAVTSAHHEQRNSLWIASGKKFAINIAISPRLLENNMNKYRKHDCEGHCMEWIMRRGSPFKQVWKVFVKGVTPERLTFSGYYFVTKVTVTHQKRNKIWATRLTVRVQIFAASVALFTSLFVLRMTSKIIVTKCLQWSSRVATSWTTYKLLINICFKFLLNVAEGSPVFACFEVSSKIPSFCDVLFIVSRMVTDFEKKKFSLIFKGSWSMQNV